MDYWEKAKQAGQPLLPQDQWVEGTAYVGCHQVDGWYFFRYLGFKNNRHLWGPGCKHIAGLEHSIMNKPYSWNTDMVLPSTVVVEALLKAQWQVSKTGLLSITPTDPDEWAHAPTPKPALKPKRILNDL